MDRYPQRSLPVEHGENKAISGENLASVCFHHRTIAETRYVTCLGNCLNGNSRFYRASPDSPFPAVLKSAEIGAIPAGPAADISDLPF